MHNLFITGGAGFLGRALLDHYTRTEPDMRITVYSRDEEKQARLKARYPQHRFVLGDVTDMVALNLAMAGHEGVIHAAALKYIPQCEDQPLEAHRVNLEGTRNVIMAAVHNGIKDVVGISTDKAVSPINVYGLMKLLMERYFLAANRASATWGGPRFHLVRYGNVVASTGSVIGLWTRQAEQGGPLTITDPKMTRFWLGVPTAAHLVEESFREPGGTILVPLLPAMSMMDLARTIWWDVNGGSGLRAGNWTTTGNRGGEKLHERLIGPEEGPRARLGGELPFHWGSGDPLGTVRFVTISQDEKDDLHSPWHPEGYNSDRPERALEPQVMTQLIKEARQWTV